jgi:hypothetical protein
MIKSLVGSTVVGWTAVEMALNESPDPSALIWDHSSIPMLQLSCLHAQFSDDTSRIFSTHDVDECGLFLTVEHHHLTIAEDMSPIFRVRGLPELPCGQILGVHFQRNHRENVVSIDLRFVNCVVNLSSGEIYERNDGSFEVIRADESVLVQVDGKRPQVA